MIKIEELLKYEQPSKYIVSSTEYDDEYKTPVLTAGQAFILGYTNEEENVFDAGKEPVIIFDDFTTSVKFVDFPFKVKSSALKILHATKKCNLRYAYYLLKSLKVDTRTHKRYWISNVSQLEVPELSDEAQKEIADYLYNIEKAIENRENQINDIEKLIASKFMEYQKKYAEEKVKVSSLVKPIENIKMQDTEIEYIDISSIDNKINRIVSTTKYNLKDAPSRAKQKIMLGDILYSGVRPNLKNVAIVDSDKDNLIGSTGFIVLRSNEKVLNEYLYMYMLSEEFTDKMIRKTVGAAYPAVNKRDVLDEEIFYIPIEKQKEFVELMHGLEKQKNNIILDKKDLQDLFEFNMQKYFN